MLLPAVTCCCDKASRGSRELTWSTDAEKCELERCREIHVCGGQLAWNQLRKRMAHCA